MQVLNFDTWQTPKFTVIEIIESKPTEVEGDWGWAGHGYC